MGADRYKCTPNVSINSTGFLRTVHTVVCLVPSLTMKLQYLSGFAFISTVLGVGTILHPNTANTKCLDVRGGILANGTAVQMYARHYIPGIMNSFVAFSFDCNNTPAQLWELTAGPTAVRLNGTDFCLDAGYST